MSSEFCYSSSYDYTSSKSSYCSDKDYIKDGIIDEMQEQFSNLLKSSQDLCSAKNQINILENSIINQELNYNTEISDLNSRVESLSRSNSRLSEQNKTFRENEESLKKINSDLQLNIDYYEGLVEESKSNLETEVKKHDRKVNILKQRLNDIKNEYESLTQEYCTYSDNVKNQIKTIKDENNRNVSDLTNLLEKERNVTKSKISNLEKEKRDIIEQINNIKEERDSLNTNYSDTIRSYNDSLKKMAELSEKNVTLQSNLNTVNKHLNDFIKMTCSNDPLEAKKNIENLQSNYENVRVKYEEETKKREAAEKIIYDNEKKIEKLTTDIDSQNLRILNMQKILKAKEEEIKSLKKCIESSPEIKNAVQAVINSSKDYIDQLSLIDAFLKGEECIIPLKSLIISFIMLKRWRNLIMEKEKVYVRDQKNWWWIDHAAPPKNKFRNIMQMIEQIQEQRDNKWKENNELKVILNDASNVMTDAESRLREQQDEKMNMSNQIHEYEKIFNKYKEQYNGLSNIKVNDLLKEISILKTDISLLNEKINKEAELKNAICQELNRLKNKLIIEEELHTQTKISLEQYKNELRQANADKNALLSAKLEREHEVFTLEREVRKNKAAAQTAVQQGFILIGQNQRLNNELQKRKYDLKIANDNERKFYQAIRLAESKGNKSLSKE